MKKIIFILVSFLFITSSCSSNSTSYESENSNYFENQENFLEITEEKENQTYENGYEWAEGNNILNNDDCDDEFSGISDDALNGCYDYIYDNKPTFGDYECTDDCSGHEAGYNWAEENSIDNEDDCGGNSNSFIEGCIQYVNDNY